MALDKQEKVKVLIDFYRTTQRKRPANSHCATEVTL
ncbi:hypothetical protein [Brenneria alni]|nr:hypothetical protein [Brenneria alni]